MGFFSKLFGKKDEPSTVVFAPSDHQEMLKAYEEARNTFKYFWRELSWENRRIVPAHGFSCVKLAFKEAQKKSEPIVEYMWIGHIAFDGEIIKGILVNHPNELKNIKLGDIVETKIDQICDWMFSIGGKTYGGFSVQVIRSQMTIEERKKHDELWELNFGSFENVEFVYEQEKNPENLVEHPMSIAMKADALAHLHQNPKEIKSVDEEGYTVLHRETIAGNKTLVEMLIDSGADIGKKTPSGKTAKDYAMSLNWEHIIPLFSN